MKRCILCASDNRLLSDVITELQERDVKILCVIVTSISDEKSFVKEKCEKSNIKLICGSVDDIDNDTDHFDYLFSFNYGYRIPRWLIKKTDIALNFHPTPLFQNNGCGGRSGGVIKGEAIWGVYCHSLKKDSDEDDIVESLGYIIDNEQIKTGYDLSQYLWLKNKELFIKVLERLLIGEKLVGKPQKSDSLYNENIMSVSRRLDTIINADEVDTQIGGLRYPPFEGAFFEKDDKKYYLIDQEILDEYQADYKQYECTVQEGVVRFRFANAFDYYTLYSIWKEEFGYSFSLDLFLSDISKTNLRVVVAEIDKRIIATCAVYKENYNCAGYSFFFLKDGCVIPEYRDKGIGSKLFSVIYELALYEKMNAIELTCADFRMDAHRFYLNNGYTKKKTGVFIREI